MSSPQELRSALAAGAPSQAISKSEISLALTLAAACTCRPGPPVRGLRYAMRKHARQKGGGLAEAVSMGTHMVTTTIFASGKPHFTSTHTNSHSLNLEKKKNVDGFR